MNRIYIKTDEINSRLSLIQNAITACDYIETGTSQNLKDLFIKAGLLTKGENEC